ncbi:2-dehydropantoate 2-reductase N-terminal domain-containing protein [Nocardioides cynanchi]|uniref:2-dehydropantoate 2-reductase N-terminal domain-containing protein n=1 Tax=Nocardioides cynanchi TaxID=2558918 RepID=UPI003B51F431
MDPHHWWSAAGQVEEPKEPPVRDPKGLQPTVIRHASLRSLPESPSQVHDATPVQPLPEQTAVLVVGVVRGRLGVASSRSDPSGPGGRLRHAVLGAGGVGGLLAAALSRSGCEVVALMRESSPSGYPGAARTSLPRSSTAGRGRPSAPWTTHPRISVPMGDKGSPRGAGRGRRG